MKQKLTKENLKKDVLEAVFLTPEHREELCRIIDRRFDDPDEKPDALEEALGKIKWPFKFDHLFVENLPFAEGGGVSAAQFKVEVDGFFSRDNAATLGHLIARLLNEYQEGRKG